MRRALGLPRAGEVAAEVQGHWKGQFGEIPREFDQRRLNRFARQQAVTEAGVHRQQLHLRPKLGVQPLQEGNAP
ncbi:hypothetical protein [Deinococcus multiflagellatus]|uniref:Transposase n=1 Tax=Deinococcus multiflagellatus TaxID=1656887 RepID=A0ABW1ZDZ4_9DEIO